MYASSQDMFHPAFRRINKRQHALAWVLIAAVHVAALAGLMVARTAPEPPVLSQTMMVSFISEQVETPPEPPPPEPPPPELPKPLPKLVSTPRPTPSAIVTPPPEEEVVEAPVEPPPPSAPAPGPPQEAVVPPNFVAAYLNNPGPQYPYTSKQRREEGTVMLKVLVSPAGSAEQVLIDRSSGYSRLDDAAADIVKTRWRFVPAKQGDRAVSAWVLIPISFELKNR